MQTYAITIERILGTKCTRAIVYEGVLVDGKLTQKKIVNVAEYVDARIAVEAAIRGYNGVGVLLEDGTVDFPDETSVTEALEAYYPHRFR